MSCSLNILFSLLQGHYNKLSEEEKQILEALMNDEGQIPSNIGIVNYDYWEKWLESILFSALIILISLKIVYVICRISVRWKH